MALPKIPLPQETVQVGGVDVTLHGLSVEQMRKLQVMGEEDAEAAGIQALAWGADISAEEAAAWVEENSPQFGLELADHVMRLSGHTASAAARFPEGVHDGNGGSRSLRPGGPSALPSPGDS